MNLREQFIWKILIALSFVIILIYVYNSFSAYSTYGKLRNNYQNDIDKVKENKEMQEKVDFITDRQDSRTNLDIDLISLIEASITNHSRAGITLNSRTGWASNEPVYKGMVGNNALIDYRELTGKRYKANDNIEGTNWIIKSFSRDSVVIEYPNGDLKSFYLESYEQIKK